MKHYIGIDLGTTNSAICSFDGKETHIWKSPEQNDITPSVVYIDRKGHRFFGRKAFDMAAVNEKNSASLFKRYLGTSKTYSFADAGISMTPVECSAQLLQVLYGYLPEEIRKDPETVTVITVPAAFNQMKKDATQEAARLAGIGQIALMQEPVAAVMSVLKKDDAEKVFVVYDLGGGTFDVSVARLIGGHVSLLAQGGREMCGGRDMDRWIYQNRILPHLRESFSLPDDPDGEEKYLSMKRVALHAAEEAKIALSSSEKAEIWVDEDTLHTTDEEGKEIYLEMTLTRKDIEESVLRMAEDTAQMTQKTLERAGVLADQVDQIVFVGGPTVYAQLREEVCRRLNIPTGTVVNPMTAVAEGASIYAESINWESDQHTRREAFEEIPENERIRIRYESRTAGKSGKIAVLVSDSKLRNVQILSDMGDGSEPFFDSGKVSIVRQGIVEVPLPGPGTYRFVLNAWDAEGNLCLENEKIEITRAMASVESIPASHSIAIKALDRPGGRPVPIYLVEANDPLPKSGQLLLRAATQLVAGSLDSLRFSLWEGEIPEPIDDNRYIGTYRIPGNAFSEGTVPVGAEIYCDYEINEAGNLRLGVCIPCVGIAMDNRNFYSRFEGQVDLQNTYSLVKETNELLERTALMKLRIVDPELDQVRNKLFEIRSVFSHSSDPENIAQAESDLLGAYQKVATLHQRYANVVRSQDLQKVIDEFGDLQNDARDDEVASFRNLVEGARYSIDMGSSDFSDQIGEMKRIMSAIRWRQDGYIRRLFSVLIMNPGDYTDRAAFDRLKAEGLTCLENKKMDDLRGVVNKLWDIRKKQDSIRIEEMFEEVGVYQG